MTDEQFDVLLKEALITSVKRQWIDISLDEESDIQNTASPSLDKKITKLAKNPAKYLKRYYMPVYRKALQRVAVVFLIMATLFGSAMLHPAARAWVKEIIVTWFGDHNEYSYSDQSGKPISGDWDFEYIPEGFELSFEVQDPFIHIYEYQNIKGELLTVEITADTVKPHIDNEHYKYSNVKVGDYDADVYASTNPQWSNRMLYYDNNSEVLIQVSGDIDIDEIVNIARGVSQN